MWLVIAYCISVISHVFRQNKDAMVNFATRISASSRARSSADSRPNDGFESTFSRIQQIFKEAKEHKRIIIGETAGILFVIGYFWIIGMGGGGGR
jgi:hypothetical protein